jgi:hypothetical protein
MTRAFEHWLIRMEKGQAVRPVTLPCALRGPGGPSGECRSCKCLHLHAVQVFESLWHVAMWAPSRLRPAPAAWAPRSVHGGTWGWRVTHSDSRAERHEKLSSVRRFVTNSLSQLTMPRASDSRVLSRYSRAAPAPARALPSVAECLQ